ncbi:hypothetical protein [Serratia microhaemolytica]|uniref:hypothetical protein n=1 Tax=Serratia microhaemolytica TaxID=2675110 RepID=UPI000FDF0B3A|nr:hypothetical protein [Serratia microhaemolytica]
MTNKDIPTLNISKEMLQKLMLENKFTKKEIVKLNKVAEREGTNPGQDHECLLTNNCMEKRLM